MEPARVTRLDDLERIRIRDLVYMPIRRPLGATAFAVNAYTAEPGQEIIESHDETSPGAGRHEELYVVISGRATFELDGEQFLVTASVGIVLAEGDEDPGELIAQADAAMYRSKELGRARYEIFSERNTTLGYLGLTRIRPMMEDPNVRKAIAHAVNRDEIVGTLFEGGLAEAVSTPLPPSVPGYDESLTELSPQFDVEASKALLDEAGWGVIWRTGHYTRSKAVAKLHGLGKNEELLGWLYVGGKPPKARPGRRKAVDARHHFSRLPSANRDYSHLEVQS